jgi:glyoxylase-like metal-dependent hydrolase (beta-lactamase superfamily II)
MDRIPVSEKDVVPLDQVANDVVGLRIGMVNVFAVLSSAGWVLVDAGLPLSADRIRRWTTVHFGENARPQSIILTHGHFDHVGGLKELADTWDVPIYVHPLEMPYVTGKKEYPPPDPAVGGGLMALMSPLYPRGPIDVSAHARPFAEDGSIPDLPGWRWIHTPGHTEGHVSFFREDDRTLIVGDAFCTTKAESVLAIATQRAELHGPPAYYTSDWDSARRSVEQLAALHPNTVAPGHGLPMTGAGLAEGLNRLAENFDSVARPKHGRYAA